MANTDLYRNYCVHLENLGLLRDTSVYDNSSHVDFSSVSYLGIHNNQYVKSAALEALEKYGVGSTGSRILSGNYALCNEFEEEIARDKNHDSALLLSSGYNANLSLLFSLCDTRVTRGKEICVFFDKMNHASLYYAILSTKTTLLRYNNVDLCHLEDLLKKHCKMDTLNIIVSETVFGVNGKIVDVNTLYSLAKKYDAILVLDEAHDLGILGCYGLGTTQSLKLDENVIITGSFGKSIGVVGGYIVCSRFMRQYLIQKGGSVIYSNNMPGCIVAAIQCAWRLSKTMDSVRKQILCLSRRLQDRLSVGFNGTNIFSFEICGRDKYNSIIQHFRNNRVIACFLRPPTTPTYTVKVAVNAYHTIDDIGKLVDVCTSCAVR